MNFPKPKPIMDEDFKDRIRQLPCVVCGVSPPNTVSHIKTRGSGGDDSWYNCTPKCWACHCKWESMSAWEFCEDYPHFKEYLEELGWFWDGPKLKHPGYMRGNA